MERAGTPVDAEALTRQEDLRQHFIMIFLVRPETI
jgi:hypothetical protein